MALMTIWRYKIIRHDVVLMVRARGGRRRRHVTERLCLPGNSENIVGYSENIVRATKFTNLRRANLCKLLATTRLKFA